MTAATKNSAAASTDDHEDRAARVTGPAPRTSLDELARAQEELTLEIRGLVARQVLEHTGTDDERERAGRLVTLARADLLGQLREQEQEQARRQLDQATRSTEDAVDGVVRSVTTVVRSLVPAALVRPEDLIEAAYTVADQGLRVSRRLALSVTGSVRSLTTGL
ncbi:hypothetical protein GB931_16705 [Modestobacter sp. I12A-02628]|uniref:Uncharacterized protein n=1 Tax=Goekera deserti TaxID=2497753 RepID=A0A7K3WGH5_9ACTN|nr:hypothetical protein [Goekera deserti]MPQ99525.1 hypothetical protein [Goekera deserti]NDI46463.1 hypothetical protein [Goekera deserti]NEL54603.1 hypothetical protein [Goekera deserti]